MKKVFLLISAISILTTACAFHGKQAKDDTYYKRTQGIEWPAD